METCIQCGKPVKDEPGETTVIYCVADDVFLCDWHCENERRLEDENRTNDTNRAEQASDCITRSDSEQDECERA